MTLTLQNWPLWRTRTSITITIFRIINGDAIHSDFYLPEQDLYMKLFLPSPPQAPENAQ